MSGIHRPIEVVLACIGEGARDSGCKPGPEVLLQGGLLDGLRRPGREIHVGTPVWARPEQAATRLETVAAFSQALAEVIGLAVQAGRLPLVLGGDHSCAIGTWTGLARGLRQKGRAAPGLVWIDAHLDAHTPHTSHSQAPHGMPLAALLGHGHPSLTGVGGWCGKLAPGRVVVLGARSYEPQEQALLARLGVRVMYMPELVRRGLHACLSEAIEVVGAAGAWGVTLDVDALDPLEFEGTGSPEPGGIELAEALAALRGLADLPGFAGFELCEYNPWRDYGGRSAAAARELVRAVFLSPVTGYVA